MVNRLDPKRRPVAADFTRHWLVFNDPRRRELVAAYAPTEWAGKLARRSAAAARLSGGRRHQAPPAGARIIRYV